MLIEIKTQIIIQCNKEYFKTSVIEIEINNQNNFFYDMFIYFSVPKAQPLVYAQIPFYVTNLSATEAILETIKVGVYIVFSHYCHLQIP